MARALLHRKVMGGVQDNSRDVSRDEWNDSHRTGLTGPVEIWTDCLAAAFSLIEGRLAMLGANGGAAVAVQTVGGGAQYFAGGAAMGVVEFSTGTLINATGSAGFALHSVVTDTANAVVRASDCAGPLRFATRVFLPNLLTGGDETSVRFGFGRNHTTTTNCAVLEWAPVAHGGNNWRLRTGDDAASGAVDTGVAATAQRWMALEIELTTTEARARIDDGLWVSRTANLPAARHGICGGIAKAGVTAHGVSRQVGVDYIWASWLPSQPRGFA